MDATTYFKWNRAADLLAPLLFESLGDGNTSTIVKVKTKDFEGAETFAKNTPLGIALVLGHQEGWIRIWHKSSQREGDKGLHHLYNHASAEISFTDKGIHDIASLLYGYEDPAG